MAGPTESGNPAERFVSNLLMKAHRGPSCAPSAYPCTHLGAINRSRVLPRQRCDPVGQRCARQPGIAQIGPANADADCTSRLRPRCSSAVQEESVSDVSADGPPSPAKSLPPTSEEWEVDFCSRPLLDERGKKVWELLICNADRSFEHSEYFPNNRINSSEVSGVHYLLFLLGSRSM